MNKPISVGNIRMFLTSCTCGRTWETDTELAAIPAHHCHQLVSDQALGSAIATYVCTGCSWKVEIHIDNDAALQRAFDQHLLTFTEADTMSRSIHPDYDILRALEASRSPKRPNTPDVITERPGPNGPIKSRRITTKRICDGCDQPIGDVTEAELNYAMSGLNLPSVIAEHGCQEGTA